MTESEWLSELWPIFSRLVGFDLVELTSEPEEALFGKRHQDFVP